MDVCFAGVVVVESLGLLLTAGQGPGVATCLLCWCSHVLGTVVETQPQVSLADFLIILGATAVP